MLFQSHIYINRIFVLTFLVLTLFSLSQCSESPLLRADEDNGSKSIRNVSKAQIKQWLKKGDRYYKGLKTITRVKKALYYYKKGIINHTASEEIYWKAARASAFLSEHSKTEDTKSNYAEKGARYGKKGIKLNKNSAECHYYYAVNLGLYADVNRWEALSLLPKMEKEALTSLKLKPELDHGGAYLYLGRLYNEAPGFTIGDKNKALQFLKKACEIASYYPPNLLEYAKALLENGKKKIARRYLRKILKIKKLKEENYFLAKWKKEARNLLKQSR